MAARTRSQFDAAIHRVPPCPVSCYSSNGSACDGSGFVSGYSVDIACVKSQRLRNCNHSIRTGVKTAADHAVIAELLPSGTLSRNYAAENIFGAEKLRFDRLDALEICCKTVADKTALVKQKVCNLIRIAVEMGMD
jgi:hypothetical protein